LLSVKSNAFDQPDVSVITPVDTHCGRSKDMYVVVINDYGRYQHISAYWDDIIKKWRHTSNGDPIYNEVVRTLQNDEL